MFGLLHIFTIISYYFYSTAYISLKRNQIKKGKEQNTWCNRNQSFLLHIFTIISYYFYSTAYISLKRNQIRKGKEQNTWCNRNQSFLQCSCVENGERRNYPQCNMISPTMHTRWHSVCVGGILKLSELDSLSNFTFVCVWWGGILKLSEPDSLSNFTFVCGGGILKLSEPDSLSNFTFGGVF